MKREVIVIGPEITKKENNASQKSIISFCLYWRLVLIIYDYKYYIIFKNIYLIFYPLKYRFNKTINAYYCNLHNRNCT